MKKNGDQPTESPMRDEYDFSSGIRGKYAERYSSTAQETSESKTTAKILLLHLSDVHIKTAEDSILKRTSRIVDAIKNIEPEARAVVCVLSGDITYAGTDDQFLWALDFVGHVKTELAKQLPKQTEIFFIAVPGNHDCDFTEGTAARAVLREVVQKTPARLQDRSFADICLAPQRRFFQFLNALDRPIERTASSKEPRIFSEYEVSVDGQTILLCCCNTAVISELHERPGSLVFPVGLLPNSRSEAMVSVGVIHHPYNWIHPDFARDFRKRLESITDFVLTGHEHTLDRRTVTSDAGNNLYLEGGVLSDSTDAQKSEFYAVVINLTSKKQRIIGFSWDGDRYIPAGSEDPRQYHLWEDFAQNRLRLRDTFQLKPEFAEYLQDPELTLTHRIRGELKLSDIYVFPDLKRVNLTGEKGTKIVTGEEITTLVEQNPCLFLVGDDVSGKTALAKALFKHLHDIGDVPILIDAGVTALSADRCEEQLENAFLQNYAASALNSYRQLDRANRVVIIDNYHRIKLTSRGRVELLEQLRTQSFRLIVLAHDIAITLHDMSEAGESIAGELPFSYYSILPFSQLRRNRIVEKWLLLGKDADQDTAQFVHNLEQVTNTIDTLIGTNYVPAYPPYVLAVLQGTEAGTEIDVNASTHGYLYELFIKAAIAKSGSAVAYNIISAYLAHLAYWMFCAQRKEITEPELRTLHDQIHERFEVLESFEEQTRQLVESRLLRGLNGVFSFRHPYIYYYFLAVFLRDHLSEKSIIQDVRSLASQLYKEESASTLLFLAHLSKDRLILKTLLGEAKSQYAKAPEATLEKDVKFLNRLDGTIRRLKLPDKSGRESRKEQLKIIDRTEKQQQQFEAAQRAELESVNTALGQLNAALKTIQILGQLLKNFPANFDRQEKDQIINACCSLGRRVLGDILGLVEKNETAFLQDMVQLIARRRSNIGAQKLRERAVSAVSALAELASAGIIIRMSHSLGSKDLTTTYERLFPQTQISILRLVYASLRLEHYEEFPEGLIVDEARRLKNNALAFRVLRFLVVRYLAIFPTDFRLKQRLSELLRLDFQSVRLPKKEQKLLT